MTEGLIERVTNSLCRDKNVRGVLLTGSRARGDAHPGSDLDLLVLVDSLTGPSFCAEIVADTLVERHFRDRVRAKARLLENPVELYSYLDGRTLYDPDGLLAELTEFAGNRFETYRTSACEKSAIFYWLKSASLKLNAAMAAGDTQKLGYYASINSWKVLEGLWAYNDKPMPPAGTVWAHVSDLQAVPESLEVSLRELFEGDARRRAQVMLELINWLLEAERGNREV